MELSFFLKNCDNLILTQFIDITYDDYIVVIWQDMLFDLLTYPDGPRVRDRISHGETDVMATTPMDVAHHVLCISAALCLHFLEPESDLFQVSMQGYPFCFS